MRRFFLSVASVAALAACSHFGPSSEQVSKDQIARVPPQDLAGVNQACVNLAEAEDEVARQQLAVNSAKDEVEVANDEIETVEARIDKLNSEIKKAEQDRNTATLQRAQQQLKLANAQLDAAKARVTSAKSGVDLANSQMAQAEAQRDLAKDQLEYEQYLALKRSGDPEWKKVNANGIQSRLDDDKKKVEQARLDVQHQQTRTAANRAAWQAAVQTYQRMSGTGGAGSNK